MQLSNGLMMINNEIVVVPDGPLDNNGGDEFAD
jgi:hypothetical protein